MEVEQFDELIARFKPQANETIKEFQDFVECNFEHFDRDGDGFLSQEELEAAIHEENRTVKEVGFLNFLLLRIRDIAASYAEEGEQKRDCISKMDVQEYFSKL